MNKENKLTILALSWRDIKAPKSGGAEVHTHEMLSRADKSKYEIIHFSPRIGDAPKKEIIDGVTYLRSGNIITVIFEAMKYYKRHRNQIDFVIDQCNTLKNGCCTSIERMQSLQCQNLQNRNWLIEDLMQIG